MSNFEFVIISAKKVVPVSNNLDLSTLMGPISVIAFLVLIGLIVLFKRKPEKYINERGYVVLTESNELEHRYIAKQLLGRELNDREVVHHINGNKTDNEIRNLCLMDREKHEFFHSWLRWKKEKSGKYPSFRDQNRILEEEYGGTLLEKIENVSQAKNVPAYKNDLNPQKLLFEELRKERKRIAAEKKVPVYLVCGNRTLEEIAEVMPDSEAALLQIRGVGPMKIEMYGACLIAVVKKYKKDFNIESKRKSDIA